MGTYSEISLVTPHVQYTEVKSCEQHLEETSAYCMQHSGFLHSQWPSDLRY